MINKLLKALMWTGLGLQALSVIMLICAMLYLFVAPFIKIDMILRKRGIWTGVSDEEMKEITELTLKESQSIVVKALFIFALGFSLGYCACHVLEKRSTCEVRE